MSNPSSVSPCIKLLNVNVPSFPTLIVMFLYSDHVDVSSVVLYLYFASFIELHMTKIFLPL